MANQVLDDKDRKNIIFDVVDGIPPSGDEPDAVKSFRSKIESDNNVLEFSALRNFFSSTTALPL